jgi:protein-disulfide isomerase
MVNQAVGTEVAGVQPIGEGGASQADLEQMVNQAVETQVQALIPTTTPIPPTPTRIPNPVADDGDAFLGPEDAAVTIVEFSDFQCSYCGKFYDETLPRIREAYPDQVKFVYRDFPIFGEDSARAAMAAECAEEQGKFWEMHNYLFDTHNAAEPVTMDQSTLVSIAGELDMDTDAFSECLSSERYMEEVLNDYQTAQQYGFRGTPGFVINGVVYTMGAQPFEVFDRIIQSELELVDAGG